MGNMRLDEFRVIVPELGVTLERIQTSDPS